MKKLTILLAFAILAFTSCTKEVTLPKNEYKNPHNKTLTADSVNINSRLINTIDNTDIIAFTVYNKNTNKLLDSFSIGVQTSCYSCVTDAGTNQVLHLGYDRNYPNVDTICGFGYNFIATISKSSQKAYCNFEMIQNGYTLKAYIQEIKF